MIRAMYTVATGMHAVQQGIDVTADNLSNMQTFGHKKSRAEFKDLYHQKIKMAGLGNRYFNSSPVGVDIGLGVKTSAVVKEFAQGSLQNTQNELDVAVEGKGFFQIEKSDGGIYYTRAGNFILNATGEVTTTDGDRLYPTVVIPEKVVGIGIDRSGLISIRRSDAAAVVEDVGQVELATFTNLAGLESKGDNLYAQTEASGDPILALPGSEGFGTVLQGFLEMSNVSVVDELTKMIMLQRAYETIAKVMQTSDDMLQVTNQIKR